MLFSKLQSANRRGNASSSRSASPERYAGRSGGGKPAAGSGQTSAHWHQIAGQWDQLGPPLRPSAEDTGAYEEAIRRWGCSTALRGLILGVTPELYHLPWPAGSHITAVDRTERMIELVWPGARSDAICADWTEMPLEAESRDIALCDAGTVLLSYPDGHEQLVRELARILSPSGLCVFRLCVLPEIPEAPQAVLDDLIGGRIPNLNILKLRLAMAMQERPEQGVPLNRIWDELHHRAPDLGQLAAHIGWSYQHLAAINTYRHCPNPYSFLTLAEVCQLFCESPGGFWCESVYQPSYALGERCPIVVFRRN